MAKKRVGLKNRIYKVGIELEGGWYKLPEGFSPENIVHDGSVRNLPMPMHPATGKLIAVRAGEIPSPPLDVDAWEPWVREYYPQTVNETCGLHIHMSFKYKLHYMKLMTPEFTSHIVTGLLLWAGKEKFSGKHPIWNRLTRKDHEHCAHMYLGDAQARNAAKVYRTSNNFKPNESRYTAINYTWAHMIRNYGADRGTVECRLLPMMETPDQAISGLREVMTLTNKFLSKLRDKEPRRELKVLLSQPAETTFNSYV